MATQTTYGAFNPEEKNVAPGSYIGLFKPIDSYEQPSPMGVVLKGAANLLDKGIEAADALIKNEARNQTETKLEPMRDEYTTALRNATGYVEAVTRPAASPTYTTDLVPGPEGGSPAGTPIQAVDLPPEQDSLLARAEVQPPELKDFERRIDTLNSARQDGKFSETEFWGRVRDQVKDIRNRFPIGYRPEVDAMVAAKFGTTPANAYIQGMIRDINASLTAGKEQKNSTLNWLRTKSEVPGIPEVFTALNNGQIDINTAVQRASVPLQEQYKQEQYKRDLETQGEEMKVKKGLAETKAQGIANSIMTEYLSSVTTASGVDGKLEEILIKAQRGDITLNPAQSQKYAQDAEALRIQARAKVIKDLTEIRNGASYQSRTSAKFVNDLADEVSNRFAVIRDGFAKGDISVATQQTRIMEAAKQDFQYHGVFDYPEMGKILAITDLLKKYNVPEAQIQNMVAPLMNSGRPEMRKFNEFINLSKFQLTVPAELEGSLPTGMGLNTPTFKSGLEKIKQVWESNGIKGDELPNHIDEFTKIIDGKHGVSLVNSDDPQIIDAIAKRVFGPGNENAFKYFNENTYDDKGRIIPGAQALYNRFSQTDVVQKMQKASPIAQKYYMDFMTTTAHEDLLRNDLPKLKEAFGINNPYQLEWNTETRNFKVVPNTQFQDASGGQYPLNKEYRTRLERSVANVNTVLDGLTNIGKVTGKKDEALDAFVLQPITKSLGDISSTPGLSLGVASLIRNAYNEKASAEKAAAEDAAATKKKYTNPPPKGQ